jgi:hypothetical protein
LPAPRRNQEQNKGRHRVADNEERKIMKTKILLAIAAAGLSFATVANAADMFTSPKGAQLQFDLRKVAGLTPDVLDRSVKAGSPRALDFAHSLRTMPGSTPDMLVRNLPAAPPRLLANEPWRLDRFQIAPLK